MLRRRLIAALSSAALAAGFLAGAAIPANAAEIGTITVTYQGSPGDTTLSVDQLVGSVGDTFIVQNAFTGTDLEIVSDSAAISEDGTECTGSRACPVGFGQQGTFTVDGLGSFQIVPASTSGLSTRTASIVGSQQASPTPSVTMTFDGNGGNCSSNPIEISGNGGATYNLPAEGSGSGQCQRDNYTLLGWSHEQGATSVDPNLTPGASVTFSNASGTMYAVWQADESFSEVTYDSNMVATDLCWDNDANNVDPLRYDWSNSGLDTVYPRETTVLESSLEPPASQAVCKPPFLVLASWNTEPNGSGTTYELDQPLGEVAPSLRLYAQWDLPRVEVGIRSVSWTGLGSLEPLADGDPVRLSPLILSYGTNVEISVFDRLGRPAPNTLVPLATQWPMTITGADSGSFILAQSDSEGISYHSVFDPAVALVPSDTSLPSPFSLITWTAGEGSDATGVPSFLVFPIYRP